MKEIPQGRRLTVWCGETDEKDLFGEAQGDDPIFLDIRVIVVL